MYCLNCIGRFAHSSKGRLVAPLMDTGVWNAHYHGILTRIKEFWKVCESYTKTPPRPVAGTTMAHEFNENIAIDLKQWKGRWILHMIFIWSKYSLR